MVKFYVSESKDEAGECYSWEEKRDRERNLTILESRIEKDGKRKETNERRVERNKEKEGDFFEWKEEKRKLFYFKSKKKKRDEGRKGRERERREGEKAFYYALVGLGSCRHSCARTAMTRPLTPISPPL